MPRRSAALLAAGLTLILAAGRSPGLLRVHAAPTGKCKTVVKTVHGKKKKVKVCARATPTATVPPRFSGPADLAVDGTGAIFVADQKNTRIEVLSSAGATVAVWTPQTSSPATFGQLYGIALDGSGNVYVSDASASAIDKLDPSGHLLAQWSTDSAEPHSFPTLLAVASNGDIYVSDHTAEAVLHLAPDGRLLGEIGKGTFGDPYGVALGSDGDLYVADMAAGCVRRFAPSGALKASWGCTGGTRLVEPTAVAVDGAGNVYVAEHTGKIAVFDPSGTRTHEWSAGLKLIDPSGIAVDRAGTIYVTDYEANRIEKISAAGKLLATWR